GYQIWTSDIAGGNRIKIAGQPGHLYFGPVWSPDGNWLAYQDCQPRKDPGHDWSDVCVGRPDGSDQRVLTEGGAMWFGATYGNPANRGGGSNLVAWTHDNAILFPRRLPGSKVPWEFQPGRPDTDQFNRDYKPDLARGGTEICRLRSDQRVLTEGGAMWFGATYGNPANRGGGSNLVAWTHDNAILFPRRLPGSKVPWEFQPGRPDTDQFNRDYKPDLARGGTEICRL